MAKKEQEPKQAPQRGKKIGTGYATKMGKMGWAEAQRLLYPESNIALQNTVSADAIRNELERNEQAVEEAAKQPPAQELDNEQAM